MKNTIQQLLRSRRIEWTEEEDEISKTINLLGEGKK